jgi:hypothetical protein
MKKINFQFSLPVTFLREGKRFVAYSPALDLSTSGRTFEEAQKMFFEAAVIFFEEIAKRGTTGEVLENLGWRKIKKDWQPPMVVSQKLETVNICA